MYGRLLRHLWHRRDEHFNFNFNIVDTDAKEAAIRVSTSLGFKDFTKTNIQK